MFAMLFEMTSTFSCWADMPVAAVRRACIYGYSLSDATEPLDGAAGQVGGVFHGLDDALVGAADLDHPGDLQDRIDVAALQHPLVETAGGVGIGLGVGGVLEEVAPVLVEDRAVVEQEHGDL